MWGNWLLSAGFVRVGDLLLAQQTEAMWNLFLQVPLVAAFMIFSVWLMREHRASNKQNQDEVMAFVDSQNRRWQECLTEERVRRKEAMDQGFKEVQDIVGSVDKLTGAISAISNAMIQHDTAARERHGETLRRLDRIDKV